MSGFANAILGGAANLIRKAIASPNYVPATSGWSINKDGTAEFANAIIRGTLQTGDTQYILIEAGPNGNRIQFFSGDPGEVAPGVVQVGQPAAGQATLTVQAPDLGYGSPPALTLTSGALETDNNADLSSPYSLSESAEIFSAFFSQLFDLTADKINLSGGAGGVNVTGIIGAADGITLPAGKYAKRGVLAVVPAGSFQNGWTNFGSGYQAAGFIEFSDGTAGLTGVVSGGTITSGTVIFTLPAALKPAAHHVWDSPGTGGKHSQISVHSDGNVVIQTPDVGTTWVSLDPCRWPIAGF